jgi:hypothetical protein
MSRPDV